MTKLPPIVRRDGVTYSLLFVAWAVCIYFVNSHYSYFGTPPPGVDLSMQQSPAAAAKSLADSIAQQRRFLLSEKNLVRRGSILETTGAAYYRLFAMTRKREYLDSAIAFCTGALRENSKAASAYFLLGRIMREKKEFSSAKDHYEKAIACDPRSPLLQQTLGILLWFDLKQPDLAKPHLEKALSLDSSFPTAHYVLGVIALEKNDVESARGHFENELKIFNALLSSHKNPPVDPSDIRMAACFSSLRLAFLYSSSFADAQKAQDVFNMYLKLETDPQRRQESVNEIQKYWKTGQPQKSFR
jgi:tetratricopeptide (TPR) repeat protein